MEAYFSIMFEDARQEKNLYSLSSLTDPDILKRSKFTDHEVNIVKNLALEKLHRPKMFRRILCFTNIRIVSSV